MKLKKQNQQETYTAAFKALDESMRLGDISRDLKDAFIHRHLIDHGKLDHASISYHTAVEYIRAEIKLPKMSQKYSFVFRDRSWYKKLRNNLSL